MIENGQYLEELYSEYLRNPQTLPPDWRSYFANLDQIPSRAHSAPAPQETSQSCQVKALIESFRTFGHLAASINPLEQAPPSPQNIPQLELSSFSLSDADLQSDFPTEGLLPKGTASLQEILLRLKNVYCSTIGYEYMFLPPSEMKDWIQSRIESDDFQKDLNVESKQKILKLLNQSELFEVFLHTKYVGQKRFSLEGGESMIPTLQTLIEKAAEDEGDEFYIGMAHRGRLNVLTNILDKSYAEVFYEFDEAYIPDSFGGSGDVKYHKGFSSDIALPSGKKVKIELAPNPSHLESINPVLEGMVRSRQDQKGDESRRHVIPILIHGDAALAGQGVVYETLQMYRLNGYTTGGTIHVVINNQIGFTTEPKDDRSTRYCTDIAKAFDAPIFHVNGEDPEACVRVATLAAEIRQKFHCDVFIDIVCYRKFGHNEADEPAFTQPVTYEQIKKKRPVRDLYSDRLIHGGVMEKKIAEQLEDEFKKALQDEHNEIQTSSKNGNKTLYKFTRDETLFHHIMTGVPLTTLKEIVQALSKPPEGIPFHSKIVALAKDRQKMGEGSKPIDWGMGEILAYASLLWQGTNIRLSGQDVCRGTFSHRHAVWFNQKDNSPYCPLDFLKEKQGKFHIYNSLLSEYAVLGFEFGYSVTQPSALVIWEAQFGDFANGAQVVVDQYVSSSEQKWGQKCNLVMLLPHGYEGAGPEHSSGRMERYLTLAGHDNMVVANCSTPAQLFHLLRRQILRSVKKPLVVFTPKALLRHPDCVSHVDDLTKGSFMEVLNDPQPPANPTRLAFCTGKIYYDLAAERKKDPHSDLVLIRIEQLYPFDEERVSDLLKLYPAIKDFYWVQEEPENMGAWEYIRMRLQKLLPNGAVLEYIGRERSASTAAGSYTLHKSEVKSIFSRVFPPKQPSIFDMAGQHK